MTVKEARELMEKNFKMPFSTNLSEEQKRNSEELMSGLKATFIRAKKPEDSSQKSQDLSK
jgi:hypothetical protein